MKITLGAAAWVIFISLAHYYLNCRSVGGEAARIGYMPVVSNLSVPIMAEAASLNKVPQLEPIKFSSFADMADALRHGQLDAAFMIAPLAIALRQQGVDIKICYIGNRHESTMVVRKDIVNIRELAGRSVAVPLRYSGHYILLRELCERFGILERVRIVEMNPPDMASALMTRALDGYFVGEPFAAQSVRAGKARVLFDVEELWPGFICNVMVARTRFLEERGDEARRLIGGAARAGMWAKDHLDEAASIAAKWWGQPVETIMFALTGRSGRVLFDRFYPVEEELRGLALRMVRQGLVANDDIDGLIDPRFCPPRKISVINSLKDIFPR